MSNSFQIKEGEVLQVGVSYECPTKRQSIWLATVEDRKWWQFWKPRSVFVSFKIVEKGPK